VTKAKTFGLLEQWIGGLMKKQIQKTQQFQNPIAPSITNIFSSLL
jgi:hypothetical protein